MKVRVCDSLMGTGKTSAAITQMKEDVDSKYIFITPYLDEIQRIKKCCEERNFYEPYNIGNGKLYDLHKLLAEKRNIASTHALFSYYNETTMQLIHEGGYKLIMDEVSEVVQAMPVSKDDLNLLLHDRVIVIDDNNKVKWNYDEYDGKFTELRDLILSGHVTLYNQCLFMWEFPASVFATFSDVIILTYMFNAQVQKYYFDVNKIDVEYIGVKNKDGIYRFCEHPVLPEFVSILRDKIHIVEDAKLNKIGNPYGSLSKTWFSNAARDRGRPKIKQLKNNLSNVFINRFKSPVDNNLWTTFNDFKDLLKGKGYTNGYLACNARATNSFRDRNCLAYCINKFYNPFLKIYFIEHGILIREDNYAISEMIQWIWRSAIRDGKEIWIYIPSLRMRELLKNWLDDMASDGAADKYVEDEL